MGSKTRSDHRSAAAAPIGGASQLFLKFAQPCRGAEAARNLLPSEAYYSTTGIGHIVGQLHERPAAFGIVVEENVVMLTLPEVPV
jgi:hypothetical protein